MDIASIIGFVAGTVFILVSIFWGADWQIAKTGVFIDIPSVMITIGGTIAGVILAHPFDKLASGLKAIKKIFVVTKSDPAREIANIITLANMARKEGILSLEEAVSDMEDEFLKKGIMLIVDGTDPELVRNILETEMSYIEGRHSDARGVWELISAQGPAWGMIGTLIGLVLMLMDLSDLAMLGPSMAIAIITTLYGSIIANFIANPVINKLKIYNGEEMHIKEVLVEGILSIQAGENPRIIEEKLRAFLSPTLRRGMDNEKNEPKGGDE
ncbi:MAG: motility protein A [Clostridiales bacterium]|nr:motility protein A [Clostridiales bacterium]